MFKPLSIQKYFCLIQMHFSLVSFPDLVAICCFPVKLLFLLPHIPKSKKWEILCGNQTLIKNIIYGQTSFNLEISFFDFSPSDSICFCILSRSCFSLPFSCKSFVFASSCSYNNSKMENIAWTTKL